MESRIRPVDKNEVKEVIILCKAHAAFENSSYDQVNKVEMLTEAIFCDAPELFCLVAEYNNTIIGYSTYMVQYSTWDAAPYIYMDCLYISDGYRGHGLGFEFMNRIRAEGQKLGCRTMQWQTPVTNLDAIGFYQRIGAHAKRKDRFFMDID